MSHPFPLHSGAAPTNCMDCEHKRVISDRDPHDWFCDDDQAVVCAITPNPKQNVGSKYLSDRSAFRSSAIACRPNRLRAEAATPDWCPLRLHAVPTPS